MHTTKTTSEAAFEDFLTANGLTFRKIQEAETPRPDYLVLADGLELMVEIKELAEDEAFGVAIDPSRPYIRLHRRTPGEHVRRKIASSRKQIRFAAERGLPSALIIYNKLDPLHLFGTEDRDFTTALYGELTLRLDKKTGAVEDSYHGRNQSLREERNTEFSAIGKLYPRNGILVVTLFENVYAKVKIPFEKMPPCLEVQRVTVTS